MDAGFQPTQRPPRWLWVLPRVALLLSLAAVGTLLWLLHRNDVEEQRAALIGDVLWVEQNVRFQLDRNIEQLLSLGLDRASEQITAEAFEARARNILRNGQGLIRIVALDAQGKATLSVPPQSGERMAAVASGISPSPSTFDLAYQLGRPQYSGAYSVVGADTQFEVHVPLSNHHQFAGVMVGVYSLRTLLGQFIPWWFAEKYKLNIIDDNATVLASKSNVAAGSTSLSYQMPFDPPGRGLSLQVLAYRADTRLLPALLVATIVSLSIAIVLSLWALRRHVLRRYQAESALRSEHAFRKAMEDSLLTGLRARDLEGRITYVNPAFCRMVGWSAQELIGLKPPMPYWPPENAEKIRRIHDGILSGHQPREGVDVMLMRKSGERFDALIYEAPLIDAQGKHAGWMGSVLDVTANKRAEEMARQQQERLQFTSRLVTMGEMASTLAHELNQPLSAIASYNAGCLNKLEAGEFTRDEMIQVSRKLGQQAQRAGQIIRRTYEFVRRSEPNLMRCNINDVVDDALGFIETDARKREVPIEKEFADGLGDVMADRVMVEQVLLNLIRNAIDAMQDTPPPHRSVVVATHAMKDGIAVSVADHGVGIAADVAASLFAPFFTTKAEGMGMGLNICRSIVELHEGRLWFEPRPGGGTVFTFSLPAAQ